ncbi:type VI secretion system accessory protein TagJ [Pseudoalteromonas sp. 68 DY56-GL68]|uniref:type VI secretion system accessory protein TagJ n=1 Tax=Pseudoalteromonas sp. 68 DY56-GL68 TaxID=2974919 RepID=UPI00352AC42D
MREIHALIRNGKLKEALEYCAEKLKDDPLNFDIRSAYTELLCVNGELEKADKQLDFMVTKSPEFAVGAVNLRHLIRAEQARQDFYAGKAAPKLFHDANELDEAFLEMHINLLANDIDKATEIAAQVEQLRTNTVEDQQAAIRDLDDSINPYLEILGTNGEFYLARFDEIEKLEFEPVDSIVEQIWLRAEVIIKNGPSGTAHIPLVYPYSETELEKLGQVTEWQELSENLIQGKGMKMFYANDEAILISDLGRFIA